ncbi:unnamed protein product [Arctogadus glacialis]
MGLNFVNEALNPFATLARLSAVCTSAVYVWGSPALREAMRRTVWGRVCPKCNRRSKGPWIALISAGAALVLMAYVYASAKKKKKRWANFDADDGSTCSASN